MQISFGEKHSYKVLIEFMDIKVHTNIIQKCYNIMFYNITRYYINL